MATPKKTKYGYRLQICVDGVRDSATKPTLREINAWASIRTSEILAEAKANKSDRHTLKELLIQYQQEVSPKNRGERWEIVRINAFLKSTLPVNKALTDCTSEALGKWRDERLKKVSAGTILRDFGLLSAIFEYARAELKWVKVNPVHDVKKPREPDHRTTLITRPQIKQILKALEYSPASPIRTMSQAVAVCFMMALRTGMRAGELCNLTWSHLHDDYCHLPVTKTVSRDVPLSQKSIKLTKKMIGFDNNLVFGLKSQTLDTMFRRAKARCGIENIHFHDARHTAATWMVKHKKIEVLTLCKIFGWKNTKQALTYYNPTASDMAKLL